MHQSSRVGVWICFRFEIVFINRYEIPILLYEVMEITSIVPNIHQVLTQMKTKLKESC